MSYVPLPDQVLTRIFASAAANKEELAGYATVCRDWATPARAVLFGSIILRSREDLMGLVELIEANPDLAHAVQRLEICEEEVAWMNSALARLPRKLDQVTSLRIASSSKVPAQARPWIFWNLFRTSAGQFKKVTELEIDGMAFTYQRDISDCIYSFPAVRRVYCKNTTVVRDAPPKLFPTTTVDAQTRPAIYVAPLMAPTRKLRDAMARGVYPNLTDEDHIALVALCKAISCAQHPHGGCEYSFERIEGELARWTISARCEGTKSSLTVLVEPTSRYDDDSQQVRHALVNGTLRLATRYTVDSETSPLFLDLDAALAPLPKFQLLTVEWAVYGDEREAGAKVGPLRHALLQELRDTRRLQLDLHAKPWPLRRVVHIFYLPRSRPRVSFVPDKSVID